MPAKCDGGSRNFPSSCKQRIGLTLEKMYRKGGCCGRAFGIELAPSRPGQQRKGRRRVPRGPETWDTIGQRSSRPRSKEGSDMLVLSRKLGEKIYINDNICITIVDIDRGKIRLGIEAPRNVPIFRQELLTEAPAQPNADVPVLAAK